MIYLVVFFKKLFLPVLLITVVLVTPVYCNDVGDVILSDETEITLLTSTPGEELYSAFGHSALRVNDPVNDIDISYNYGTFNFSTPNFYTKFASGRLLYMLSVRPYRYYAPQYEFEGRAIYEQVLNLNMQEKQVLFEFLQENALPENKYYHYDFFHDNCATRIRDIVDNLYDIDWYNGPYEIYDKSFRDLITPYLVNMPWVMFGIDIALGLPADKIVNPYDYMFLPDELFLAFAMAKMADGNSLVEDHRLLVEETLVPAEPHFLRPMFVFWFIFVLALLTFFNNRSAKIFDITFFSIVSIVGLVILFLWFISDHAATNSNMNLLWALPTHIYFFVKYHMNKTNRLSRWYFKCIFFISALMILLWSWIPQGFNPAFFPVISTILIKSIEPAFDIDAREKIMACKKKIFGNR